MSANNETQPTSPRPLGYMHNMEPPNSYAIYNSDQRHVRTVRIWPDYSVTINYTSNAPPLERMPSDWARPLIEDWLRTGHTYALYIYTPSWSTRAWTTLSQWAMAIYRWSTCYQSHQ